jgi:hypothetical protein
MDAHEMEARINAHREVLISLMASMMADSRHMQVFDELERDAVFRNGEEDPGIVPTRVLGAARARAAIA